MGTDAIIYSTKKKIGCNIDRAYNIVNGAGDYELEYKFSREGLSLNEATAFINQIIAEPMDTEDDRPDLYDRRKYWLNHALAFIATLDGDDIVKFCTDETDEWLDADRWDAENEQKTNIL